MGLRELCSRMAAMTAPICAEECPAPNSCCAPEYCGLAKERMAENGVWVAETGHPTLPYMGLTGCIVEPQYRLLCTVHVCCIQNVGAREGRPDWTAEYYALRSQIDEALVDEQLKRGVQDDKNVI